MSRLGTIGCALLGAALGGTLLRRVLAAEERVDLAEVAKDWAIDQRDESRQQAAKLTAERDRLRADLARCDANFHKRLASWVPGNTFNDAMATITSLNNKLRAETERADTAERHRERAQKDGFEAVKGWTRVGEERDELRAQLSTYLARADALTTDALESRKALAAEKMAHAATKDHLVAADNARADARQKDGIAANQVYDLRTQLTWAKSRADTSEELVRMLRCHLDEALVMVDSLNEIHEIGWRAIVCMHRAIADRDVARRLHNAVVKRTTPVILDASVRPEDVRDAPRDWSYPASSLQFDDKDLCSYCGVPIGDSRWRVNLYPAPGVACLCNACGTSKESTSDAVRARVLVREASCLLRRLANPNPLATDCATCGSLKSEPLVDPTLSLRMKPATKG